MLYSLHGQFLSRTGREDIVDFEQALEAEEARRRGLRLPRGVGFPNWLFYSEIPLYTEQIQRYIDVFGWQQIHIIIFDDIVNEVEQVYRELLRFLEVDDEFSPTYVVRNTSKSLRSAHFHKFLQASWTAGIARTILPSPVRQSVKRRLRSWNRKDEPRPPMDSHVRERLKRQFAPEVERLSRLIDRDLSHWCDAEDTLQTDDAFQKWGELERQQKAR